MNSQTSERTTTNSGLEALFGRAIEVRGGAGPSAVIKQRIADAAENLSLAGHMQAHLEVMTEALMKLIEILYQVDVDGQPANYDVRTGRIFIPLPWGRAGWKHWGVRYWESECLKRILLDRVNYKRRRPPLFDYSAYSGRWHLNTTDYPTLQLALQWVQKEGPTLAEWRTVVGEYRERAQARMRRHRGEDATE